MTARTQPQAHPQTHIQPDHAPIEGAILLPA
jgi:hypothetical protein